MNNNKKVIVYDSIIKDAQYINAWNVENFSKEEVSEADKKILDNICVIEISFEGTHGNNLRFEGVSYEFHRFLYLLLSSISIPKFFFKTSKKQNKTKIRSYKGVIPRSINIEDFIEEEFDLPNSNSVITGIANISEESHDIIDNLFDNSTRFILLTKNHFFTKSSLNYIFEKVLEKSIYTIDYINLSKAYCSENNIIIRESGDGGDQELSWQIFTQKNNRQMIIEKIKLILSQN